MKTKIEKTLFIEMIYDCNSCLFEVGVGKNWLIIAVNQLQCSVRFWYCFLFCIQNITGDYTDIE